MAGFVNREDLETRVGVDRVRELFDDDRNGTLGDDEVATLEELCSEANDSVVSALMNKGFTTEQLVGLAGDRGLRRAACQIAMQLAGERRPEFLNELGEGPYHTQGQRGRATLKEFAKGEQRSRLENAHGANVGLRGRVSEAPPSFMGRDVTDPDDQYGDNKGF